jgi:hypothetical protein
MQISATQIDAIPNCWDVQQFTIKPFENIEHVDKEVTRLVDVKDSNGDVTHQVERLVIESEEVVSLIDKRVIHSTNRVFVSDAANTEAGAIELFNEMNNPAPLSELELEQQTQDANISQNKQAAKRLKLSVLNAPIELDGALFRYAIDDKKSILDMLQEAILLAAPDTDSMDWRLVEGVRNTSLGELKEIVKLGAIRRRTVETAYTVWCQTDMTNPFHYS